MHMNRLGRPVGHSLRHGEVRARHEAQGLRRSVRHGAVKAKGSEHTSRSEHHPDAR